MSGVLQAKWIKAHDYRKGRGGKTVATCVLHSTCGRKQGDIPTLTEKGGPVVSCHFYVTRAGELYQFVKEEDTAYHCGRVDKPEHGNQQTIGVEMEHFDDKEDWPDIQIKVVSKLSAYLRQRYGKDIPFVSHAAIAVPRGRKQDPVEFPWLIFSLYVRSAMKTQWTLHRR